MSPLNSIHYLRGQCYAFWVLCREEREQVAWIAAMEDESLMLRVYDLNDLTWEDHSLLLISQTGREQHEE